MQQFIARDVRMLKNIFLYKAIVKLIQIHADTCQDIPISSLMRLDCGTIDHGNAHSDWGGGVHTWESREFIPQDLIH